jgi:hypothetical protein
MESRRRLGNCVVMDLSALKEGMPETSSKSRLFFRSMFVPIPGAEDNDHAMLYSSLGRVLFGNDPQPAAVCRNLMARRSGSARRTSTLKSVIPTPARPERLEVPVGTRCLCHEVNCGHVILLRAC